MDIKKSNQIELSSEIKCEGENCLLAFVADSDPVNLESAFLSSRIKSEIFGIKEENPILCVNDISEEPR